VSATGLELENLSSILYSSFTPAWVICRGTGEARQAGLWDLDECFERLSVAGDPLEKLNSIIPLPVLGKPLAKALKRADG
jgi:hypothetical protein